MVHTERTMSAAMENGSPHCEKEGPLISQRNNHHEHWPCTTGGASACPGGCLGVPAGRSARSLAAPFRPHASFRGGLLLTFAYRMFMFVELSSPRRLHGPVIVTMSEKEVSRT